MQAVPGIEDEKGILGALGEDVALRGDRGRYQPVAERGKRAFPHAAAVARAVHRELLAQRRDQEPVRRRAPVEVRPCRDRGGVPLKGAARCHEIEALAHDPNPLVTRRDDRVVARDLLEVRRPLDHTVGRDRYEFGREVGKQPGFHEHMHRGVSPQRGAADIG
jgi:hypothetical protein